MRLAGEVHYFAGFSILIERRNLHGAMDYVNSRGKLSNLYFILFAISN